MDIKNTKNLNKVYMETINNILNIYENASNKQKDEMNKILKNYVPIQHDLEEELYDIKLSSSEILNLFRKLNKCIKK